MLPTLQDFGRSVIRICKGPVTDDTLANEGAFFKPLDTVYRL